MPLRFVQRVPPGAAFTWVALLVLATQPAQAQWPTATGPTMGESVIIAQETSPRGRLPSTGQTPPAPATQQPPQADQNQLAESESPFSGSAAVGGETGAFAAPGYIDSAIVRNLFRLRYDNAQDDNRPDRAEFFYPKCGCFRTAPAPLTDPKAPGPPDPEHNIDFQEITTYLELALSDCFSGFVEVPVRFLHAQDNKDASGVGDFNAGVKYALIHCDDQWVTAQFRAYFPTGNARLGLGTDHVSLEPAILVHQCLADKLALDAEVRDWIPIGGTDFAGNVIRYGVGLSYEVYNCSHVRVLPVVELVGWTVLSGKEFDATSGAVFDAAGDTIVNAKAGVRAAWGCNDIYVGYGRALTGDVWYKDIIRVEYRLAF